MRILPLILTGKSRPDFKTVQLAVELRYIGSFADTQKAFAQNGRVFAAGANFWEVFPPAGLHQELRIEKNRRVAGPRPRSYDLIRHILKFRFYFLLLAFQAP